MGCYDRRFELELDLRRAIARMEYQLATQCMQADERAEVQGMIGFNRRQLRQLTFEE